MHPLDSHLRPLVYGNNTQNWDFNCLDAKIKRGAFASSAVD